MCSVCIEPYRDNVTRSWTQTSHPYFKVHSPYTLLFFPVAIVMMFLLIDYVNINEGGFSDENSGDAFGYGLWRYGPAAVAFFKSWVMHKSWTIQYAFFQCLLTTSISQRAQPQLKNATAKFRLGIHLSFWCSGTAWSHKIHTVRHMRSCSAMNSQS